uniref:Uncharacterized protein n=1 Tax=Romanomermis culicivorax TaxID=13658 RepID=A0A915KAT4_ROMCU
MTKKANLTRHQWQKVGQYVKRNRQNFGRRIVKGNFLKMIDLKLMRIKIRRLEKEYPDRVLPLLKDLMDQIDSQFY